MEEIKIGSQIDIKADIPVDTPNLNVSTQPARKSGSSTGPKGGFWWGTGRRKSSVARVRIKLGDGKLQVNKKELKEYFVREQDRKAVLSPLVTVDAKKTFDIFINVKGGGTTGQAGASLLGIARALKKYDTSYMQALRDGGHLTRDPRMVERKKPGQKGARKRFQFSKR
jgi:small subunit ribosomal protein S9